MRLSALRRLDSGTVKRSRLVALPYAGGGAHLYQPLAAALNDVEVWAAEYPGHATRLAEPLVADLEALAAEVAHELTALDERPLVLLGYSMGAAVAFEIARRLRALGALRGLIACAARAPTRSWAGRGSVADMDDDGLLAHVVERGGTPRALLEHPELLELALPVLRADFLACERYRCDEPSSLSIPIVALRGARDEDVSAADVDAWGRLTQATFQHDVVAGDHFFVHDDAAGFPAWVRRQVGALVAQPATA